MNTCTRCSNNFECSLKSVLLCPKCKLELDIISDPQPNRKCHDCGTPTFDYRCRECQLAFKVRNKVSGGVCESESTSIALRGMP